MSEITPTAEELEIVEETSGLETGHRSAREKHDLRSIAETIREELGIVDGKVTLTFLDDGI